MKTRIIYTKFWHDNYISELSYKEKLVFIYLITNEKVNICGVYELPDKYIRFDLGLRQSELDKIKQKFQKDGRFAFTDSWIKIINYKLYNKFTGEKNESAIIRELALIPKKIIDYQYSIDRVSSNLDTLNNHKSIINNKKSIIRKGDGKGELSTDKKINYAEFVLMTPEEYQKLIAKYGEKNTKKFIEKLNNTKGANKKLVYTSDYYAILKWVVEAVLGEDKKKELEKDYQLGIQKEKEWKKTKKEEAYKHKPIPSKIKEQIHKVLNIPDRDKLNKLKEDKL